MGIRFVETGFKTINVLLILVVVPRVILPFYFTYGLSVIRHLNSGTGFDITILWAAVLSPWNVILGISGLEAIKIHDRETIFENGFKFCLYGLLQVWLISGFGPRFQHFAPYLLDHKIKRYYKNAADKEAIDDVQIQLNCCGYENYRTWTDTFPNKTDIPLSCCQNNVKNETECPRYIKRIGCLYLLNDYTEIYGLWLTIANLPHIELLMSAWSILFVEFLPPMEINYERELDESSENPEEEAEEEEEEEKTETPQIITQIPVTTQPLEQTSTTKPT